MKKLVSSLVAALCLVGLSVPAFAADDKAEKAFKKMDKDGNGSISVEEYVGKKTGEKADKAKTRFGKLDKDQNGSLSLEEFKSGMKKKKDA